MYQNYTINQLCLPIDLEAKIEENDFVHAIVQFVDSIPDAVFLPYYQSMGRPQYHPRMLLSIILCAYFQGLFDQGYPYTLKYFFSKQKSIYSHPLQFLYHLCIKHSH